MDLGVAGHQGFLNESVFLSSAVRRNDGECEPVSRSFRRGICDRAKVMTKASQWLKVLIVNTGVPVVVCGMPEAEYVLRAEHTERRFKERLTLRCFT